MIKKNRKKRGRNWPWLVNILLINNENKRKKFVQYRNLISFGKIQIFFNYVIFKLKSYYTHIYETEYYYNDQIVLF